MGPWVLLVLLNKSGKLLLMNSLGLLSVPTYTNFVYVRVIIKNNNNIKKHPLFKLNIEEDLRGNSSLCHIAKGDKYRYHHS